MVGIKRKNTPEKGVFFSQAGNGTRTHDILLGKKPITSTPAPEVEK
jgi:hypothetical protein